MCGMTDAMNRSQRADIFLEGMADAIHQEADAINRSLPRRGGRHLWVPTGMKDNLGVLRMQQELYPVGRFPHLKHYDYSQPGSYFVTICVKDRRKMFGDVVDGAMNPNPVGEIVQAVWDNLPERIPGVLSDACVIMPNHFHGIIVITEPGLTTTDGQKLTLGEIVRVFKSRTSYYIHASGTAEFHWQQKYWDTILRNDRQSLFVRQYIANNPAQWTFDKLYQ
jgi:putative transposase